MRFLPQTIETVVRTRETEVRFSPAKSNLRKEIVSRVQKIPASPFSSYFSRYHVV